MKIEFTKVKIHSMKFYVAERN